MEQEKFNDLSREVKVLKRQNQILLILLLVVFPLIIFLDFTPTCAAGSSESEKRFQNIRVKRLLVEDEIGNDRIIISLNIAKMKSYYSNDKFEGILILDKKGFDN